MPRTLKVKVPEPAEILYQPARYKALHGGRGSGKSTSIADALIIQGYQKPMKILCCREIQKSIAASVYDLLLRRIGELGLADAYRATQSGIYGTNGTQFLFAGLRTNPKSIQSMDFLDIAWIEEADRCSQASLDLLTPTLRKEGSELWVCWNRHSESDPIDNFFLGGPPPPDSEVRQMNWRDNPFFPDVLRKEMDWLKQRDYDKYMHVWEGEPLARSEARVFKNWTIDDLDDQIGNAQPRFGADWGMRDPTVLVKVYRIDNILYIAEEAYKVEAIIDEIPALFAGDSRGKRWGNKWKHTGLTDVLKGIVIADSASPQIIRYLKDRGFSIRGAVKGPGSIEEGIEFMQSCDLVVHPRCVHSIDELSTYAYKIDPHTDEVLPELEDKDNHVIDAIRYALEGERKARPASFHGGIKKTY